LGISNKWIIHGDRIVPKTFDNCVKAGGRVRRKALSGGRYINICFKGSKSYAGYVKHSKGQPKGKKGLGGR